MKDSNKAWWRAPKGVKAIFLIALLLFSGSISVGCGGAGVLGVIAGGLCIPCWVIVVVGAALAYETYQLFVHNDDPDCPPDDPTPPPVDPPVSRTLWFGVHNDPTSACQIDRVAVDGTAWVFDAHDPVTPPDFPANGVYMNPAKMSWPEGANPQLPSGVLTGSHLMNTPVWTFVGASKKWATAPGYFGVVIHFNNGQVLNLGAQYIDYGTTFRVAWDATAGPRLLGTYQQVLPAQVLVQTQGGAYVVDLDPDFGAETVDMLTQEELVPN